GGAVHHRGAWQTLQLGHETLLARRCASPRRPLRALCRRGDRAGSRPWAQKARRFEAVSPWRITTVVVCLTPSDAFSSVRTWVPTASGTWTSGVLPMTWPFSLTFVHGYVSRVRKPWLSSDGGAVAAGAAGGAETGFGAGAA